MAVQDEASFKRYTANGIATVYAIPFLLLNAADLVVILDNEPVTSGYIVTGVGSNTGTITFAMAPTGDLLLQREVPFERLTDYQDNGDLLADTVNRDYDRIWLALQELRRDDSTALRTSTLEPEGILSLPLKAARSARVLAFDPVGNPVTSNLTLQQLEQQPALALGSASAAARSATEAEEFRDASGEYALAALTSANLAAQWAENPEDVPVSPGFFSAHHWANKAAALVASISGLYARMTAVELRATNLEWGYVSTQQSFTNGGSLTVNHLLTAPPGRLDADLVFTAADAGYAIGDVVELGPSQSAANGGASYGFNIQKTTSQLLVQIATSGILIVNKSSKALQAVTPGSVRLILKASKS